MRENITKHQRKFSLSLSVNNLYLDLYYVLMEVTVTPFAEVLSHRNRPTSWKAQQLNLITLMELGNFPFGVGFLTRQIRAILPQVFCEKKPYSSPATSFSLIRGKFWFHQFKGYGALWLTDVVRDLDQCLIFPLGLVSCTSRWSLVPGRCTHAVALGSQHHKTSSCDVNVHRVRCLRIHRLLNRQKATFIQDRLALRFIPWIVSYRGVFVRKINYFRCDFQF